MDYIKVFFSKVNEMSMARSHLQNVWFFREGLAIWNTLYYGKNLLQVIMYSSLTCCKKLRKNTFFELRYM